MATATHATNRSITSSARRRLSEHSLVECPVCQAPNGYARAGCFNCGSLLRPEEDDSRASLERLAFGEGDLPGRVEYVRR
jgi:hypothetical protein